MVQWLHHYDALSESILYRWYSNVKVTAWVFRLNVVTLKCYVLLTIGTQHCVLPNVFVCNMRPWRYHLLT
jgi:hypothetical protein